MISNSPKQSKQCLIIQVRPSNDILHCILPDRIANALRPNILSTTFFTISMIIPVLCYVAYSIISNSYIKEIFYQASHISTIVSSLFQFFTFNCQILRRTIFIFEVQYKCLMVAVMIIARSVILCNQTHLNTIDYISASIRFVALYLLIHGTSCFDAWHVKKFFKLVVIIGVILISIYQYLRYSLLTDDFNLELFGNIELFANIQYSISMRSTSISAMVNIILFFFKQLWSLIRRWNTNEAIAVISHSKIQWNEWINDNDKTNVHNINNGHENGNNKGNPNI